MSIDLNDVCRKQDDTGHIGIHGGVDFRMEVRTYGRTVDEVMAEKSRFLASMGYHIFLNYGASCARGTPLTGKRGGRY